MPAIDIGSVLFTTAVLHWLNLVVPGPNALLVSGLAATGQRRAALVAGTGMATMVLIWAIVTAVGLSALLHTSGSLRASLQIAGGGWYCFLALQLWRAGRRIATPLSAPSRGCAFLLGMVTSAANPAASLFYLTIFLVQVPHDDALSVNGLVTVILVADTLVWYSLLALLLSRPGVSQVYQRHQRLLCRVCSMLMGLMGAAVIQRSMLMA